VSAAFSIGATIALRLSSGAALSAVPVVLDVNHELPLATDTVEKVGQHFSGEILFLVELKIRSYYPIPLETNPTSGANDAFGANPAVLRAMRHDRFGSTAVA